MSRRTWIGFTLLAAMYGACSSNDAPAPTGAGPSFDGIAWVAPDHDGKLWLAYKEAKDPKTDASRMRYRIYGSTVSGRATSFPARLTTLAGVTMVVLDAQPHDTRQFITVRAVNEAGFEDTNRIEKSALAQPDTSPPTFGGLTTIGKALNAGVTLSWDPAIDDASPPEAMTYEVFGGTTATGVDFTRVLGATGLGETTITLSRQGQPGEQRLFAVRARDVAGNVDANTKAVAGTLGPDAEPPTFAGCATVKATTSSHIDITWTAAKDDFTPADKISYDVFVSTTQQGSTTPTLSVVGSTSASVDKLMPGATYYVTCHARDAANNVDTNTNQRTVVMNSDGVPPKFGGITSISGFDPVYRQVTLNWDVAIDDVTSSANIVYDVYQSTTSLGEKFDAAPLVSSSPGASSIVLTNLDANDTLYWVVHARDEAGNDDANTVERTGTTNVSFKQNVIPTLSADCAVVGCHVSGIATGGLVMSPAFAYGNLVSVASNEKGGAWTYRIDPGSPTTSYLYRKIAPIPEGLSIVGSKMPAPSTGNTLSTAELTLIKQWITDGAPNN